MISHRNVNKFLLKAMIVKQSSSPSSALEELVSYTVGYSGRLLLCTARVELPASVVMGV